MSIIHILMLIVFWSTAALVINIIIEWLGIFFNFWPKTHAQVMLATEISWLNQDFKSDYLSPGNAAVIFAQKFYQFLFVWDGKDIAQYLMNLIPSNDAKDYFFSAILVTQIFAVRVIIILFSLPIFLFFGLAAFIDGLVERDLRKWGGGREHSLLYHQVKPWITPAFILPIVIYLALPISLHPNYILLPFALVFSTALWMTAALFKKHL